MVRLDTEHGKDPLPAVCQRSLLRRLATRFLDELGDRRTFQRWSYLVVFGEADSLSGRTRQRYLHGPTRRLFRPTPLCPKLRSRRLVTCTRTSSRQTTEDSTDYAHARGGEMCFAGQMAAIRSNGAAERDGV